MTTNGKEERFGLREQRRTVDRAHAARQLERLIAQTQVRVVVDTDDQPIGVDVTAQDQIESQNRTQLHCTL